MLLGILEKRIQIFGIILHRVLAFFYWILSIFLTGFFKNSPKGEYLHYPKDFAIILHTCLENYPQH